MALGAAQSGQPQSSFNPNIWLVKVVVYDSLLIKVPIIGGSIYYLASGELLSEATATPTANATLGEAKPSYV